MNASIHAQSTRLTTRKNENIYVTTKYTNVAKNNTEMIRKRSVAIELRLRADAEAKKAAKARLKSIMLRFTTGTLAGK